MKKTVIVVMLLCSLCLFAAPVVNSRIIDSQSELYDYMDRLYALNGKAKPETNRPWSEAQARLILEKIDKPAQKGVSLSLYREIESIINEGQRWNISDDFGFSIVPEINIEGYLHTDDVNFTEEKQFVRSFADRKPWLKINFDFSVSDFFWTASDIQWRISRGSSYDVWKHYNQQYIASYKLSPTASYPEGNYYFKQKLGTNLNFNTYDFDFIFPHKAIASVGGKNWNISINRDRMKIGDAHFGNLLVDDYTDYNDYLNFAFFSKYFDYNWYIMSFNTLSGAEEAMTDEARLYLIHTLNFRIWDKVSFKISENVMYKYSTFDLQFLNPAFIYHNLNNHGLFNAIALAELNITPFKGLNIYGQYVLDQARAPNEGYSQADSSGFIAGAEYTVPALGGVLENYAEFAQTTPLLYRRDGVDFVKVSRYYHQAPAEEDELSESKFYGHFPVFEYIGFPFGGDARVLTVGTEYSKPGIITAGISATAVELGQMTIESSHNTGGDNTQDANITGKTPTGDVITRALVLSTEAEISMNKVFSYPDISFMTEVDFLTVANYKKATKEYLKVVKDLQVTVGISCSL